MINKRMPNAAEAVADIPDGATSWWGLRRSRSPSNCCTRLIDQGLGSAIISNNCGSGEVGLAALLKARRVTKVICSFPKTANSTVFPELYREGFTELELVPQGTLAERIRAGGAGVKAFYTPTAVGTPLAEGKESREFDGRTYLLEHGLTADFALIKGVQADEHGNVTYNKTARNFAPVMAMAARTSIVQTAIVSAPGELDPEVVVTPGIFIDRVVEVPHPAHESELIAAESATHEHVESCARLGSRSHGTPLGQDIPNGSYINLGIGIPELVAKFVPEGRTFIYHTEERTLGHGAISEEGQEDPELINAGKRHVTANPGAAYFHHADSFAMIRGGHLGFEHPRCHADFSIRRSGQLVHRKAWAFRPWVGHGLGGWGQKSLRPPQHTTKTREPKLVESCTYPLTGQGVVDRIYTDLAVIDITPAGFQTVELAPGVPFEHVQAMTGAPLSPPPASPSE